MPLLKLEADLQRPLSVVPHKRERPHTIQPNSRALSLASCHARA
jgi:hypothetical protein